MIKKVGKFIISFKFAIILFIVIATYSIIGTVLPQGAAVEFYLEKYQTFGNIIVFLQFNKVYSSFIYRTLLFLFLVNLTGCTINLLPSQLRRLSDEYFPGPLKDTENLWNEKMDMENFKLSLGKKGFKIKDTEKGFKASKHKFGVLGPSVTHLGILIIILGSFLGNMFAQEGFVNLLPGESNTFSEYGFTLKVDDFYLGFREDGTTEQYYSELKIIEKGEEVKSKKIWVNNPLNHKGLNIYQSSFGWVSNLVIKDKEGNVLEKKMLKNNQQHFYQPKHLTVYLYGFYPEFGIDQMGQPQTISQQMKDPHYAVVLYEFNNYIDSYIVEPGRPIPYDDIEIVFEDSKMYTGLIYRKDFGYYFVMLGCLLMFLGLFLSFYFYPKFVLVEEERVLPITRQNIWGFSLQIKNIIASNNKIKKGEI